MTSRLVKELTSHQNERRTDHCRVGMTFGIPSPIFAAANAWAKGEGRSVALWRGGGLNGAFSAVGKIIRQSDVAQDAALAFLLPSEISDARVLWKALRDEEQRRFIDRARPEGPTRDVLDLLGHPESAIGDDSGQ